MRDVHDRHPARLETADQIEQHSDIGRTEAAGWLVEDEDAAAGRERPRDLDELLRGGLQGRDLSIWPNIVVPELLQRLDRDVAHAPALDETVTHRLDPEHDVLHHAEVRRERQLLMDHRNTGAAGFERIARCVRHVVDPHRALVWRNGAGEDRHQRALARAVLADKRAHLARMHRQARAIERDGGAEPLTHAPHLEARPAYGFSHRDKSGCNSSFASASFM